MPKKNDDNPFDSSMAQSILDNLKAGKTRDYTKIETFGEVENFGNVNMNQLEQATIDPVIDHLKRRQDMANEAAMQPITLRLDEIIYLLKVILDYLTK